MGTVKYDNQVQEVVIADSRDLHEFDSMDVYLDSYTPSTPGRRWSRGKTKSVFRPPKGSMRSVYSTRSMRWKWRGISKALKRATPLYEGNREVGYGVLLLQFLKTAVTIWWAGCRISTRAMRKIVIVEITTIMILGLLFSAAGIFKLTHFPDNAHIQDFYWAMTIVAVVVLTLSVLGTIGIFRPSILVTEIFAVLSFVFGHLIFSIVVSWYLLIFLDTYLTGRFLDETRERERDVPESNIYQGDILDTYFKLLIAVSLIMMSAGAITTKLLIQTRKNQGYVDVYADNAPQ
ncbi:hypothetical protein GE061_017411 [Apolygus lucorum]|uniref:Uncharacterized protein n=1 Tax=Apolygus lucorum TaxID=248454 RepID=A0A8S9XB43_APOLU|nr:hypothetical protein GE061_017411 [Apolygus lucorum]